MAAVIGLDGIEREWAEVFAGGAETALHGHGLATIVGHVVRRTVFDGGAHEDVVIFLGARSFGRAIERKDEVAAEQGSAGHAVVDCLYACGCRGAG